MKNKYSFCNLDFGKNGCGQPMVFIDLFGGSYNVVVKDKKTADRAIADLKDMIVEIKKFSKEKFGNS